MSDDKPSGTVAPPNVRRRRVLLAALAGLAVAMVAIVAARQQPTPKREVPLHVSGADVPNILEVGDPEGAIRQCQALYQHLKRNGWSNQGVPFDLMRLPDQKYAESKIMREPRTGGIAIPGQLSGPYRKVAFYTPLYVRFNVRQYSGERTQAKPEGFYIVGWKDGRIEKVPVEKVRIMRDPKHERRLVNCFPGMDEYSESLPQLPEVQASKGKRVVGPPRRR